MERRIRLQPTDTPQTLARAGNGDPRELQLANKSWLGSDFQAWNPGQQMTVPSAWAPLPGEYPSE